MSELMKRMVYTSVGAVTITKEKFKELVEDLIQNQHFTEDEGKRIIDTFLVDCRSQIDSIHGSIQLKFDDILQRLGIRDLRTLKNEMEDYVQEVKNNPIALLRLPSKK